MKIMSIAANTYKESARQPVYYILLALGAVMILTSPLVVFFAFGEEEKMIKDMALATITITTLLIAVLSSSAVISDEIEKKTALTVLSKPVSRTEFILGKFVGICYSVFLGGVFLSVVLLITATNMSRDLFSLEAWYAISVLLKGVVAMLMQTIVVTSVSVAVATRLGTVPNLVISTSVFVLGHLSNYIYLHLSEGKGVAGAVASVLYAIVPNLEHFNVSSAVAVGKDIPGILMLWMVVYAVLYCTAALCIAIVLFERRELT